MPDWTKSMSQTYEYYIVDPNTWRDKSLVKTILSCSIDRDNDSDTLGSASISSTESLGECYLRVYLVTIQNGIKEKHPLGTFLVQTPSSSFDGKIKTVDMDAYTPLLELKENQPPIGYFISKNENIMDIGYRLTRENLRAPVVKTDNQKTLYSDFISDPNDTWMSFLKDLISNAGYNFDLDELGRIIYSPVQDTASLQPVWTYNDDNSSILYPEISLDNDIYNIPNVVEVIYSSTTEHYYARVVNDNVNSPISIVSRGREIIHRVTNPNFIGSPSNTLVKEYAEKLLKELSSIEYTLTYSHGYCPVRVNDCVRLNYKKANIVNVKARVISQSISCESGCPVSETAVFTTNLWR